MALRIISKKYNGSTFIMSISLKEGCKNDWVEQNVL